MSATTQLTTFSDLFTDLLNSVREETGVTATENIAKRYVNTALHDMHIGTSEKLPWAERRARLVTNPPYNTGTIAVDRGSTTVTGTGTDWNSNNEAGVANVRAGGKIRFGGGPTVYEVSSVSSDTSLAVTSNFTGDTETTGSITAFANAGGGQVTLTSAAHGLVNTMQIQITETLDASSDGTANGVYDGTYTITNKTDDTFEITATFDASGVVGSWKSGSLSGAAYDYYEDEYALASDFLRPIDLQQFSDGLVVELIGRREFRTRYPRNRIPGRPAVATLVDLNFSSSTTPVRKIRFHRPPDDFYTIPYQYITSNLAVSSAGAAQTQLSADADEPIVPLRYRHAIKFHALYHWYRDRKDDTRSQEAKAEYVDLLTRTVSDNEVGTSRPQLQPRMGAYRSRAVRPWGGGRSRRYDVNGRFDRMED